MSSVRVDIDGEAGVGVAVGTRESDKFGSCRSQASSTSNQDLSTFRVELSRKRVKSDGLKTDQVVSTGDSRRDGYGPGAVLSDH